jgi:hypothetical protein
VDKDSKEKDTVAAAAEEAGEYSYKPTSYTMDYKATSAHVNQPLTERLRHWDVQSVNIVLAH